VRAPHRRQHVVHPHRRHQLACLLGADHARVRAERVLDGHVLAEARDVGLGGEEEEIALLPEVALRAHLVAEPLEELDAAKGELHLDFQRKLYADPAGGLAGGPRAHRVALEDEDVAGSLAREVIGDGGADGAGADDDDVGGAGNHARRSVPGSAWSRRCA
jgi:hypothetical protein